MFKKSFPTKINILANFAASGWTALLSVVFVPLYLPYISIEAYGLIGFFTGIQSFINLLDFGLSPTLNREMARLSILEDQAQKMHDLKRTLEIPNWAASLVIALLLMAVSPLVASYWLRPRDLSVNLVAQALVIMGINVAVQFSSSFYVGGLLGLQKQFFLSITNIICSTLRSVGAYLVVVFVSSNIIYFLLWQTLIAVLQLCAVFTIFNRSLPVVQFKGTFRKELLQQVWQFAAGMTGITVVSLILTQADRVVLSRMLNLEEFGYYSLALTISGMAVLMIVASITNSVYPRFSAFISVGDEKGLSDFYHKSCQILSLFLIPTTVIIAAFSYRILLIWTHDQKIADNTWLILTIVVISSGLNGLMWLPYHLQLAYGWTKLGFYVNLTAIFILVPIMVTGAYKYGAVGGAVAFGLLQVSYVLFSIQIMHRRLLKGEKWKWYIQDVLIPLVISCVVIWAGKHFFDGNWSVFFAIFYLAGLWITSAAAIILLHTELRRLFLANIIKFKPANFLSV